MQETLFEQIIAVENLLAAWREFLRGKRAKPDVQEFSLRLMDNILSLHADLCNGTYRHGPYRHFRIADPKPRDIHKATVRDRLLHHAIYRVLYPFFDCTFIADSYSCRLGKGTHRAMNRFRTFACSASKNHTRTCWVLKCDVKKFFASVDHQTLLNILRARLPDTRTVALLETIIRSFSSCHPAAPPLHLPLGEGERHVGLPLGNLTSQLLVNIYMNEFDQFVKHMLRAEYYIRYADDFVVLSHNKQWLEIILPEIETFLWNKLKLQLHPDKVFIKTFASGVDFLGWVHFPNHRVLRAATKRRMFKRIIAHTTPEALASYSGLLRHGNTFGLQRRINEVLYL
jgi:retron-type reverse transcriptase